MATPLNEATVSGLASGLERQQGRGGGQAEDLRNHRLIVMFLI